MIVAFTGGRTYSDRSRVAHVARMVGINLLSYANIERGKSEPRARAFIRTIVVLGIPIEKIPEAKL